MLTFRTTIPDDPFTLTQFALGLGAMTGAVLRSLGTRYAVFEIESEDDLPESSPLILEEVISQVREFVEEEHGLEFQVLDPIPS